MATWKCKRCDYVIRDGDEPDNCPHGPCPMEEVKTSLTKQVIGMVAMLLMLPFAAINYTIGQVCATIDNKFDDWYDRIYNWSQR